VEGKERIRYGEVANGIVGILGAREKVTRLAVPARRERGCVGGRY